MTAINNSHITLHVGGWGSSFMVDGGLDNLGHNIVVDNLWLGDMMGDNLFVVDNWSWFPVLHSFFMVGNMEPNIVVEVLHDVMMEHDLVANDLFDMAHAFHLLEEVSDFLLNLGKVVKLLDKSGHSVVSLGSDSVALSL